MAGWIIAALSSLFCLIQDLNSAERSTPSHSSCKELFNSLKHQNCDNFPAVLSIREATSTGISSISQWCVSRVRKSVAPCKCFIDQAVRCRTFLPIICEAQAWWNFSVVVKIKLLREHQTLDDTHYAAAAGQYRHVGCSLIDAMWENRGLIDSFMIVIKWI